MHNISVSIVSPYKLAFVWLHTSTIYVIVTNATSVQIIGTPK